MIYELINGELGVYSCKITDLTLEQAYDFTRLWNDGSSIEALTVFHNTDGSVVINADNKEFETFKKITIKYMMLPIDQRKELKNSMKAKSIIEIFNVIDNAFKYRERIKQDEEFQSLKKLLGKQR